MMNKYTHRKRTLSLLLIVLLLSTLPVFAQQEITVYVNGKLVVSDAAAEIVASRTMLPFRAILNALGVSDESITWNASSKSVEIRSGKTYIFLAMSSNAALVNDRLVTLDAAPYIKDSRTMIPVRFVSESLNATVDWDPATKVVTITK